MFAPMLPALRAAVPELAGLFYTGGTTGFPKGVMLSHASLGISWLGSAASGYMARPGSRTLHAAPLFHLADLTVWGITVLVGGSHVMLPAFDPAAVLSAIETEQVTDALLVPTMIQLVVDYPDLGVPDPDWGERVHAVVVLQPGATLTADELREHVKTLIAGYKAREHGGRRRAAPFRRGQGPQARTAAEVLGRERTPGSLTSPVTGPPGRPAPGGGAWQDGAMTVPRPPASPEVIVRAYAGGDYGAGRSLWAELTEYHRGIYGDPSIGGDDPGAGFDDYLAEPHRAGSGWPSPAAGSSA